MTTTTNKRNDSSNSNNNEYKNNHNDYNTNHNTKVADYGNINDIKNNNSND